MYHALLLLFVGGTTYVSASRKKVICLLILVGVILFSGSIYGLSTNALWGFDFKKIGMITPIGGSLLIVAWSILFWSLVQSKKRYKITGIAVFWAFPSPDNYRGTGGLSAVALKHIVIPNVVRNLIETICFKSFNKCLNP